MTGNTGTNDGSSNVADSLVRGMVEAMSDSGSKSVPMATTEAEKVIKAQLTENTGRHLLDSGSAYGRHWEENQDSPPWEDPTWSVEDGYVIHNVYDHMTRQLGRDRQCVAVETALYAYGYTPDRDRQAWLRTAEDFAEQLMAGDFHRPALEDLDIPHDAIEAVLGLQAELQNQSRGPGFGPSGTDPLTFNTYNHECHSLTQCLQGVNLGGPYAEMTILQVHGGCDIRGGWTAPRVYRAGDSLIPHELSFYCDKCGSSRAESCMYGTDDYLFQRSIDREELASALYERDENLTTAEEAREHADMVAAKAAERDHIDGAVFHVDDGCGGVVQF